MGLFFEAVPNNPHGLIASTSARSVPDETEHGLPSESTVIPLGLVEDSAKKKQANAIQDAEAETFTSNIAKLQHELSLLRQEAYKWQQIAQTESQGRIRLELELNKMKTLYVSLRRDALKFRNNARKSASAARALHTKITISSKGIQRMADFTQKLLKIAKPHSNTSMAQ